MLLFIEGYPYNLNAIVKDGLSVRDILKDVVSVPVKEEYYAFGYVGYCYSKAAKDVIFFLPKVTCSSLMTIHGTPLILYLSIMS